VRLDGVALLQDCSIRASLSDGDGRPANIIARIILCFPNPGCVGFLVEQMRCMWLTKSMRRGRGWRWSSGTGVRRELVGCCVDVGRECILTKGSASCLNCAHCNHANGAKAETVPIQGQFLTETDAK
jgi:hypothetical protein